MAKVSGSSNISRSKKQNTAEANSVSAQDYPGRHNEVNRLIEEETRRLLYHVSAKLPKEIFEQLDGMGGLKEKLYHCFSQNYQSMFNRYMVTAEDEMMRKVQEVIEREEIKAGSRYTPKEIASLLGEVGGADTFNTGEVEKSIVNMYGHLQGYVQRGINELETQTHSLLHQKTDVGAFVRGENAYSIVKCTFKDNNLKPKTVTDVKLAVNILDTELISPIFHYQVTAEYLIKDLISNHFMTLIDKEIERVKDELIDEGKEALTGSEVLFKKMSKVPELTDDNAENADGKRYAAVSKELMERIAHLRAEIDPKTFDPLNIRENIKRIIDTENVRNRGFNTAVNTLTSILDTTKMGYQYIENLTNARELLIREYDSTDSAELPDEHYQIRLRYFDNAQLTEERKAYEVMIHSFETEVEHLWDVVRARYDKSKEKCFGRRIADFGDLAALYEKYIQKKYKIPNGTPAYKDIPKVWDEISFVCAAETEVEKMNRTFVYEKETIRKKIAVMRERIKEMYAHHYSDKRRVMEERLAILESKFNAFDYLINPFQLQPGLLLDIDITSIKRKKTTLNGMAHVLNEFLHSVSKGFTDQALAAFTRERSVIRSSSAPVFGSSSGALYAAAGGQGDVFGMLEMSADSASTAPAAMQEPKTAPARRRGRKPQAEKDGEAEAGQAKSPRRGRKRKDELKTL